MTTPAAKPARPWGRYLEYAVYAVLAGVLLYRCVLPVPGSSLGPAESVRVAVDGVPTMVEFSASR